MRIITIFFMIQSIATYAGNQSSGEGHFRWKKKELRVCWQNESPLPSDAFLAEQLASISQLPQPFITASEKSRSLIESIITNEYTLERTGIHFIDWGNCEEAGAWDLMILVANSTEPLDGRSLIGEGSVLSETFSAKNISLAGRKSFLFINLNNQYPAISETENIKITALHEFGHVSGLRHEHIREEAKSDPLCYLQDYPILGEPIGPRTKSLNNYDPTSIMNYCFLDLIARKTGLTFDDKKIYSHLQDEAVISRDHHKIKVTITLSRADLAGLKQLYP